MIELDAKESISLRNATKEELLEAFKKLDWYFDYGPKFNRTDYLERISNILLEIRARKITGDHISAKDWIKNKLEHGQLSFSTQG